MAEVPESVVRLVERFDRNRDAYRSGGYNETQVRVELIDPLFIALGWDVHNAAGYAEAYKDVVHEDAIKVGGTTKAPDYCFRIGGARKFFLEAKKPSVDIHGEPAPAYQLRRYAWSAKLPLSILTDFEEFAVYDCRIRPRPDESAATARTLYVEYTDYADKWDQIASVFSREAVLKGSFDKYAAGRGKRGTAEVDVEFLKEIERWREALARNIALRNRGLTVRQLNYAVQRTIDRIIFLRICEGRGVETYGSLQVLLNGESIYERLMQLFRAADDRYNSGLFHFRAERGRATPVDELTPGLVVDDKVLKDIFRSLYYPQSPYEFAVLPADILGNVYEQFLGKVIHLTKGHHARVEDKPEVKKAGGVYYTPKYIVDYIVEHTVGRLLLSAQGAKLAEETQAADRPAAQAEATDPAQSSSPSPAPAGPGLSISPETLHLFRTPRQAGRLRICDPACGSGSFLVGAYRYLLRYCRDWYVADGADKHRKQVYQGAGGEWYLTTDEKKRILLKSIYGVDIDPQAVEVTKLNLLLCVLENENQGTMRQLSLIHERALPDLADNIKCGNSLIGTDFYQGKQLALFDEETRYRINAFDWEDEFSGIFKGPNPGFDAVVGNPPWGQKCTSEDGQTCEYLRRTYVSLGGISDMFRPFVERGMKLTATGGMFGMVLPDIVLLKDYPETRQFILDTLRIDHIDWWGMAFKGAVIDAATIVGMKGAPPARHRVAAHVRDPQSPVEHLIPQSDFRANPRFVFNLHLSPEKRRIVRDLERLPRLCDFFEVHEGVHSGNIRCELFVDERVDETCEKLFFGRDEIQPYLLRWEGKYVRLGAIPSKKTRKRYANAGRPEWYNRPKVLVRRTGDYVLAAVDEEGLYASNNFFIVFPNGGCSLELDGLGALLNSPFMTWYFRAIEPRKGRVFCELKIKHLSRFPLPKEVTEQGSCAELNDLGKKRTELAKSMGHARVDSELAASRRASSALDRRIGRLVARLMGVPERLLAE